MSKWKGIVIPLVSIIVLVVGNIYQGLSESDLIDFENSLTSLAFALLGAISAFSVIKERGKRKELEKKKDK